MSAAHNPHDDERDTQTECPACTPAFDRGEVVERGMIRVETGTLVRTHRCDACRGTGLVSPRRSQSGTYPRT